MVAHHANDAGSLGAVYSFDVIFPSFLEEIESVLHNIYYPERLYWQRFCILRRLMLLLIIQDIDFRPSCFQFFDALFTDAGVVALQMA